MRGWVMGMLDVRAFRAGSVFGFMRVVRGLASMRRVLLSAGSVLAALAFSGVACGFSTGGD
jgi:hypothetical protein